jgi:hypothetical protein
LRRADEQADLFETERAPETQNAAGRAAGGVRIGKY